MSKNDQNAASYVLVLMHTFRICFKKVLEQLYIKKKKSQNKTGGFENIRICNISHFY